MFQVSLHWDDLVPVPALFCVPYLLKYLEADTMAQILCIEFDRFSFQLVLPEIDVHFLRFCIDILVFS